MAAHRFAGAGLKDSQLLALEEKTNSLRDDFQETASLSLMQTGPLDLD